MTRPIVAATKTGNGASRRDLPVSRRMYFRMSLNDQTSGPPSSKVRPPASMRVTPRAMASATSPTQTGWNFVLPPPIRGRAGAVPAICANRFRKPSPVPKTMDGRKITVSGLTARAAASASPLERP